MIQAIWLPKHVFWQDQRELYIQNGSYNRLLWKLHSLITFLILNRFDQIRTLIVYVETPYFLDTFTSWSAFSFNTLWLLTHWTCVYPIFCAHLIICLGLLNFDIVTSSPPLECLNCLFVCDWQFKQTAFLCIQTLHNDCAHIEDVNQRRRSRAEFGLIFLFFNFCYFLLFYIHSKICNPSLKCFNVLLCCCFVTFC